MFRGFFNKDKAATKGKRDERGASGRRDQYRESAAPASVPGADLPVDASLVALSRELSALNEVAGSQAAKERGWAALQHELERHPVRSATPAGAKSSAATRPSAQSRQPRSFRWALASTAGVIAVVAALLGSYSGGLLTADHPTTPTSVVASSSGSQTPTTEAASTTATLPAISGSTTPATQTSQPGSTVDSTASTSGGTSTPATSAPAETDRPVDSTSDHPGTTERTTTTVKPTTSTTGETQNASEQREGSAKAAVAYLADMIITDDSSGARGLVSSQAQASLAQMMKSLNEPYGYKITVTSVSGQTVRVTLKFDDKVANADGQLVDKVKTYFLQVRVNSSGAVITAINAGA